MSIRAAVSSVFAVERGVRQLSHSLLFFQAPPSCSFWHSLELRGVGSGGW